MSFGEWIAARWDCDHENLERVECCDEHAGRPDVHECADCGTRL